MSHDIDTVVLVMLEARRGDWMDVSKASGVSYSWLSKFANGHIKNPGYSTLKKLLETLDAAATSTTSTSTQAA